MIFKGLFVDENFGLKFYFNWLIWCFLLLCKILIILLDGLILYFGSWKLGLFRILYLVFSKVFNWVFDIVSVKCLYMIIIFFIFIVI